MLKTFWGALFCMSVLARMPLHGAEPRVIDAMDEMSFKAPKEKCRIEVVEGKDGKALKFSFDNDCRNTFAFGKSKGAPDWDAAAGISFWVKGEGPRKLHLHGSDHLGGIEFIWNEDFSLRYACAFPIDGTEWRKIVVPWRDFIPETCNQNAKPLGTAGNAPSKLGPIWFGKWWYWRDYGAHSYSIDDIRLEPSIPTETGAQNSGPPLARLQAKLKAGKPVTIVTMGDSLTDFNHWANKPINWPTLLKDKLHAKFGCEVRLINPAMGGTELRQNMVLIPRWQTQAPEADLVTIWFGGNDWNSGMRGDMFRETLQDAVERVRHTSSSKADIIVMTTLPSVAEWDTMAELADACRKASAAKNTGLADIYTIFHEEGKTDRERLYCRDKTHLGPIGHERVAQAILDVIENTGR